MIRRIFSSLGISGLTLIVTMLVQILAVPVFLRYWGAQLYGEWLTLTNLVSSLNILNIGVQTHVMNLLIAHYSRGEINAGTRLLHSALRLYGLLCSVALVVTFGLAFLPSISAILNIHVISPAQVRLIIIVEGILAAYTILEGLLMSLLIVIQQLPRRLTYSLLEKIMLFGEPLVVAILLGTPLQASLWSVFGMSIIAFYQIADVRRRSPFSIGIRESSWRDAFSLLGPGLTFFAVSLSYQLLTSGTVLLISILINSTSVTLFTTTLVLTNLVRSLSYQGLNILWPEITSMAVQDPQRLAGWHRLAQKVIGAIVLCFSAVLILLGPWVLEHWTQGRIKVDALLNALLVFYLLTQYPALVARTFGLATNRQGELFRIEFSVTLAALLLSALGIPYIGLYAIPGALIITQACGTFVMLIFTARWTADTKLSLASGVFLRGAPIFIMLTVPIFLSNFLAGNFIMRFMLAALVCVINLWMSWRIWFSEEDRNLFIHHLSAFAPLKRIFS